MSSSDPSDSGLGEDIELETFPKIHYESEVTRVKRSGSFRGTITARGTGFDGSDLGPLAHVVFDHSATRQDTDIHTLFTEEEHRGRGIGGELMRRAETAAKGQGSKKMIIPMAAPKAQTLYARLGYKKVHDNLPTMEKEVSGGSRKGLLSKIKSIF